MNPNYNFNRNGSPIWQPSCPQTMFPNDTAVTMAYIPYQLDSSVYCPEIALENGTLFPSLNKPFFGGKCR